MKRILFILFLGLMLNLAGIRDSFANWSLVDDWSNLNNPNGPWSYNAGNIPLPNNVSDWALGEFGPVQTAWAYSISRGDYLPAWFKSIEDPNQQNGSYDWLAGDVLVHSTDDENGINHGLANVTWTNPVSGTYDITGGLWEARLVRSNAWGLYLDDTLLANGNIYDGDIYSRANPNTFSIDDLYIQQGRILKLQVVKTSDVGDIVGVNFNIATAPVVTPEPTSMLLFGVGGVAMAFRRFRGKFNNSLEG